mgnify:CR=1 FL=1
MPYVTLSAVCLLYSLAVGREVTPQALAGIASMPATTRLPDAIKACRDTESGNRIRRNTTYDENKAVRNHSTLLLSVMSTTCPGASVPGYRQNLEYAIPAKACGVTSLPTAREYSRHTALNPFAELHAEIIDRYHICVALDCKFIGNRLQSYEKTLKIRYFACRL